MTILLINIAFYRRALSQGSADVAYGRLMLLGPAGVGKTCFKRGLMNLPFDNKTDSTILANVQSVKPGDAVRPVSREWMTQSEGIRGWSEVSEEDEIEELAQLMVLVGTIPKETVSTRSNPTHDNTGQSINLQRLQQLMENNIIQKAMVRADSLKKCDARVLKCQPFFNLWDCGGQPVFLEVLPIFLTSRTMFLLLFNAAKNLNEPWESFYHRKGKKFLEGEVNVSTLQMMERWIALIYSHLYEKNDNPGYPRVMPIGTRGDELKQRGEDPENVLKELEDSLRSKPAMHHVLKQPIIIDNTTSGKGVHEDSGYQMVRQAMFDMTSSQLKKKTPIAWILFRKFLQLFQRSPGANIISLNDAIAISALARMQHDQVHAVLVFYHELGVLLYYPGIKGLHQKIILNPQWFVDCLGKILTLPGADVEGRFEDKMEWELLRNKGILVEKLYNYVLGKCEGIEPKELIELLMYFQLAVEVKTNEYFNKQAKQYFLPAVLPYSSTPPVFDNSSIKAAPLHVTFNAGFPIPGFFTRFSIAMLKRKHDAHPQLALYFKYGIYHNQVTYKMESLPSHFLTLTERSNIIEIDFSSYSKRSHSDIQKCSVNLKSLTQASCTDVTEGLQSLHPKVTEMITSFELKVVCQAEQCQDHPVHYLTSDPPYQDNINGSICTYVVCERDELIPRDITLEEAYWYKGITLPVDTTMSNTRHADKQNVLSSERQTTLVPTMEEPKTDPADSIARLVSTIKDVFTAHVAKLSSLLKPTIREFATEMDQEGLISQAVARDPNVLYTTIIDQFLAGLGFKEQRKIEEQCLKFFKILHNIGGPVQGASEVMKDKLIKEVQTKLNIDLNLESVPTPIDMSQLHSKKESTRPVKDASEVTKDQLLIKEVAEPSPSVRKRQRSNSSDCGTPKAEDITSRPNALPIPALLLFVFCLIIMCVVILWLYLR